MPIVPVDEEPTNEPKPKVPGGPNGPVSRQADKDVGKIILVIAVVLLLAVLIGG